MLYLVKNQVYVTLCYLLFYLIRISILYDLQSKVTTKKFVDLIYKHVCVKTKKTDIS